MSVIKADCTAEPASSYAFETSRCALSVILAGPANELDKGVSICIHYETEVLKRGSLVNLLGQEGGYEVHYDDLQIDAHGFAPFDRHAFARFPFFSTNLPFDELILAHRLVGEVGMKQERSVFDFERHRKVRRLRDGGLELTVTNETPWAPLRKGKGKRSVQGGTIGGRLTHKIRDDDEFD